MSNLSQFLPGVVVYAYDDRATLRSTPASNGKQSVVRGLGIFVWVVGSTELDDDETCFVASGGAWEMAAADPELASLELESAAGDLQDQVNAQSANHTGLLAKFLRGSFVMNLTSLAALSSTDYTATVVGAAVGDSVCVTPGNSFGTSVSDKAILNFAAYVSAANTVIVNLRNPHATNAATLSASTWRVMVFK